MVRITATTTVYGFFTLYFEITSGPPHLADRTVGRKSCFILPSPKTPVNKEILRLSLKTGLPSLSLFFSAKVMTVCYDFIVSCFSSKKEAGKSQLLSNQ